MLTDEEAHTAPLLFRKYYKAYIEKVDSVCVMAGLIVKTSASQLANNAFSFCKSMLTDVIITDAIMILLFNYILGGAI